MGLHKLHFLFHLLQPLPVIHSKGFSSLRGILSLRGIIVFLDEKERSYILKHVKTCLPAHISKKMSGYCNYTNTWHNSPQCMKWCGQSSQTLFFQDKELLKEGALVWLILHLLRLQVLAAVVKMVGLYVRLTGWQSKIWVNRKATLNDNCSLSVLTFYESLLVWVKRPVEACQNWFKDFGFIWWYGTSPLCAHTQKLQRDSDPPGLRTYLEFLLISRSIDVVHFRPFLCNVKISISVSCASGHGVWQLNIFKPF